MSDSTYIHTHSKAIEKALKSNDNSPEATSLFERVGGGVV